MSAETPKSQKGKRGSLRCQKWRHVVRHRKTYLHGFVYCKATLCLYSGWSAEKTYSVISLCFHCKRAKTSACFACPHFGLKQSPKTPQNDQNGHIFWILATSDFKSIFWNYSWLCYYIHPPSTVEELQLRFDIAISPSGHELHIATPRSAYFCKVRTVSFVCITFAYWRSFGLSLA